MLHRKVEVSLRQLEPRQHETPAGVGSTQNIGAVLLLFFCRFAFVANAGDFMLAYLIWK
jgi:hypothetical protein